MVTLRDIRGELRLSQKPQGMDELETLVIFITFITEIMLSYFLWNIFIIVVIESSLGYDAELSGTGIPRVTPCLETGMLQLHCM